MWAAPSLVFGRKATQALFSTQDSIAAKLPGAPDQARPIAHRFGQRSESIASSTQSSEGRVYRVSAEDALVHLAGAGQLEQLGKGQFGRWDSSRAMARGLSTSMPWAASPAQCLLPGPGNDVELLPGSSMANTADVASQMTSPSRPAGIHSPSGTRTPEVVPFQAKTTSRPKSTVRGGRAAGHRALRICADRETGAAGQYHSASSGRSFPRPAHRPACTQQRPERQFHRPGIGAGDDADPVVAGRPRIAGCAPALGRPLPGPGRAVGAGRARRRRGFDGPPRPLGARAEGKIRAAALMPVSSE